MKNGGFIAPPPPAESVVFSEALLWAGDMVVEKQAVRMSTVLGSCVSVCLFDTRQRFGGMNHYLVPRGGQTAIHGEWAVAHLVSRMRALGSSPDALQAKVFGGGSPLRLEHEALAIGAENAAVARTVLGSLGIPIVAERVGHGAGVRLFFENWSGVVWLRAHREGGAKAAPAVARRPRLATADVQ